MPRPGRFTSGKDLVPIVQEAGWAPGPVWTGAENLPPPGFDPQTVQSIASRYTGPQQWNYLVIILSLFIFWNVGTSWSVQDSLTLEKGSQTSTKGWPSYGCC